MLEMSASAARAHKHNWYTVQSNRNLARCYLAQGKIEKAIAKAEETIKISSGIGDKHYANMAGLVLAESYLHQGKLEECEESLVEIEQNDPNSDFFVLGSIQRIRGLAALEADDNELAVHHFNRALTIFETAEDLYHTGLLHELLGLTSTSEISRGQNGTSSRRATSIANSA
jgi:tetratricopeptide (TPR) repeat protein